MRATLEAKVVTATRAGAVRISSAKVLATSVSEGERPSRTALVESPISARQPASPSARSFASSVGGPMSGVGSIFQSPVCSTVPSGVRMMRAFDSGIECAMETSSMSNGPSVKRPPSGTMLTGICGAPGSLSRLACKQRRGERCCVDRKLEPRPQVEHRAEMVLVRVCEHDAENVFAHLDQIADVRQDQVDARQVIAGKCHAEIDDDPLPPAFVAEAVEREIHADLAHPAERRKNEFVARARHAAIRSVRRCGW